MDANQNDMQIDTSAKIDFSGKELFELKYFPVGNDNTAQKDGETVTDDRDVFVEVSRTFSKK